LRPRRQARKHNLKTLAIKIHEPPPLKRPPTPEPEEEITESSTSEGEEEEVEIRLSDISSDSAMQYLTDYDSDDTVYDELLEEKKRRLKEEKAEVKKKFIKEQRARVKQRARELRRKKRRIEKHRQNLKAEADERLDIFREPSPRYRDREAYTENLQEHRKQRKRYINTRRRECKQKRERNFTDVSDMRKRSTVTMIKAEPVIPLSVVGTVAVKINAAFQAELGRDVSLDAVYDLEGDPSEPERSHRDSLSRHSSEYRSAEDSGSERETESREHTLRSGFRLPEDSTTTNSFRDRFLTQTVDRFQNNSFRNDSFASESFRAGSVGGSFRDNNGSFRRDSNESFRQGNDSYGSQGGESFRHSPASLKTGETGSNTPGGSFRSSGPSSFRNTSGSFRDTAGAEGADRPLSSFFKREPSPLSALSAPLPPPPHD